MAENEDVEGGQGQQSDASNLDAVRNATREAIAKQDVDHVDPENLKSGESGQGAENQDSSQVDADGKELTTTSKSTEQTDGEEPPKKGS